MDRRRGPYILRLSLRPETAEERELRGMAYDN